MAALPQFQQRRLARRAGSDITRLASQFSTGINALTDEYQRAFSTYQAGVEEKMAPFQAALAQYQTKDMPAYEAAKAQYQKQLDAYNAQLKALEADPVTERTERVFVGRNWYGKKQYEDVTFYDPKPIPQFATPRQVQTLVSPERTGFLGRVIPARYRTETVYDPIEAPKLPVAPKAPEIGQFDDSGFAARKQQLQTDFQREVGERRSARLGAVSRRSSRPMLRGA